VAVRVVARVGMATYYDGGGFYVGGHLGTG
jgi:hypothetical protein